MKTSRLKSYFSYWLDAVDEHSLHSPFLFDFYSKVVKAHSEPLGPAESLRKKLSEDHRKIEVEDFGTRPSGARIISEIAKGSLSDKKFSSLYHRIIRVNNFRNIIELGTSLGINSLYLGAHQGTTVTTFEGSTSIADLAELTFQFGGAKNIRVVRGNLQQALSPSLQLLPKVDFAFLDANHTYEATTSYFKIILNRLHDKSVMVIDDIHLSAGMEDAWNEIRSHKLVYTSVDLYRAGILFFDPSLNKQHVILQF